MLIKDEEAIKYYFYRWVYRDTSLFYSPKWRNESKAGQAVPGVFLNHTQKWHNHISVAQFCLDAEQKGFCYYTSKQVVKEVIARKKLEDLLNT